MYVGANKGMNPLIRCTACCLYYHFRCIWLRPSVYIPNFTCARCKLAAARQRNVLPPADGHCQDRKTTEADSVNCDSDDMKSLGDFFDATNEVQLAGKTNNDNVKADDENDVCIMIDSD